jgi:hypothetical protein
LIEALEDINKFNMKYPQRGVNITGDTLTRSYKAKQAKERGAVDGVYLDKNLSTYLEDEYGN